MTNRRPSKDEYFSLIAKIVATRSTCSRRAVGCVLINKYNHIIATGYNGVAAGLPHCLDVPCPGAHYPSGEGLDKCEALHAEQNALLQVHNAYEITTAYVTVTPCVTCIKLLMNTSCERIVSLGKYAHDEVAIEYWQRHGRIFEYGGTP